MAKRFMDTQLYDKQWYRKLKPAQKCFYKYLLLKCDIAGLWDIDMEAASFYIGEEITLTMIDSLNAGQERVIQVENKLWICDFVEFQYGQLSEQCPPHKPVIALLKKYNLFERVIKGLVKGKERVSITLEDKDKDKDKDKDSLKGECEGEMEYHNFIPNFNRPNPDDVQAYAEQIGFAGFVLDDFMEYYDRVDWKQKDTPITKWQPLVKAWKKNQKSLSRAGPAGGIDVEAAKQEALKYAR